MATKHQPVLLEEVLKYLNPQPNQNFVDCTFGGGGHSRAILAQVEPQGKVIGIDWDPAVIKNQTKGEKNLILVCANYKNLAKIINDSGLVKIDGILLDLGLSSDQLGERGRGFGFQDQGSLDLRYNPQTNFLTGQEILRSYSFEQLAKIFKEYGEEPLATIIAKKIIELRQQGQLVETAAMLVQLVSTLYRQRFHSRSRRNPATRVFQALRLAVNQELENLQAVLPQAVAALAPGGRLVIISFHSLEDRIVKNFFRSLAKKEKPSLKILTKKPISAGFPERQNNPRSRSAKLRAAEKIN